MKRVVWVFALAVLGVESPADAQTFDGYASLLVDALPSAARDGSRDGVTELRGRVYAEYKRDLRSRVRITIAGFAEGVAGKRLREGVTTAAILRPQEISVDAVWEHADVRVGFSRVVWGRLDEFLPTDVVNPLDLTRFFLEGRAEARMPVAMVRTRWLRSDRFELETIYVPLFRSGQFDQLGEDTAPFNVAPPLPFDRQEPARTVGNAQGGVRATATTGRVDWSLSAYRGFEPLPVYEGLAARFPRFTMLGGDFETVRGPWGFRGELAAFVERTLQFATLPLTAEGRSLEGGVGLDRKAGAYRVSGNVVFTRRAPRASPPHVPAGEIDRSDLTLVASVDRSFARETRSIRAFAVYNPGDESAFARVIATFNMRDNVTLEGSGGVFTGGGSDLLARFANRDFFYARLKVFF